MYAEVTFVQKKEGGLMWQQAERLQHQLLRRSALQVWMKEAGETDLVPEGQSVPFTFSREFL